ncbi:probable LRR receptor-like serine/threonine-protein kinase At4g29180 [Neltuma alba]|uniref:probable LRR receptor-like serine/threonine-protein kinase At4g29180 n=1 Tax=Neltuma alba TaxID=207710 RepID=UPI0010A3DCD5|nr:probable LRR receptor-like serine/threonine-protein kinase At4g29180 [Prosopis alba]
MEKAPQWIVCFVLIELLLNICDAMLDDAAHRDFISIDCGASSQYTDPKIGISYHTDIGFIETGTNSIVAPETRTDFGDSFLGRQLPTLRFFPEGKKNCYTLKPKLGKNNNYLIRAFFLYGNYDFKNQTSTFDLFLNVDFWTTVALDYADYQFAEVILTPPIDTIQVCLVNIGKGIPFISVLELQALPNSVYLAPSPSQSLLVLATRVDVGSTEFISGRFTRYTDDTYDRVWRVDDVFEDKGWKKFSTSKYIDFERTNDSYKLPAEVLKSATASLNRSFALSLDYNSIWTTPTERSFIYYVYFHFVEIEELPAGQKRIKIVFVSA